MESERRAGEKLLSAGMAVRQQRWSVALGDFRHASHLAACEWKQRGLCSDAKTAAQSSLGQVVWSLNVIIWTVWMHSGCLFLLLFKRSVICTGNEKSFAEYQRYEYYNPFCCVQTVNNDCTQIKIKWSYAPLPQGACALGRIQSVSGTDGTPCASARCFEVK